MAYSMHVVIWRCSTHVAVNLTVVLCTESRSGNMLCYAVQVQTALGAIVRDSAARELPCGVFGSFGWSGEAVDELENRLKVMHYLCTHVKLTCLEL